MPKTVWPQVIPKTGISRCKVVSRPTKTRKQPPATHTEPMLYQIQKAV